MGSICRFDGSVPPHAAYPSTRSVGQDFTRTVDVGDFRRTGTVILTDRLARLSLAAMDDDNDASRYLQYHLLSARLAVGNRKIVFAGNHYADDDAFGPACFLSRFD
ncbi:hypothetical protein CCP3SC15_310002 [Gammaproteobacteria bacterium]